MGIRTENFGFTQFFKQTVIRAVDIFQQMKAVQFRIARPTNQMEAVIAFYTTGLGMKIIGRFSAHDGYDGVMLGMPDHTHHLEFTQHINKHPLPEPSQENLLVFYFDDHQQYLEANLHLQKLNHYPVKPENPYWIGRSETYEDPDKWRVVLFNGTFN